MSSLDRVRVLLSSQRALLGAITERVRVVDVSWSNSQITLRFVLDQLDEGFDEIVNDVEAQIEADFLPEANVDSVVEVISCGKPVSLFDRFPEGSARLFARYEL